MPTSAYGSAADHQGLTGLTAGDPHTQYANWQQGLFSARPIQPVRAGIQYLATDTGVLYVSSGGAWATVLGKSDTQVSRDLAQSSLSGGGLVTWDGSNLKWSARFIAISVGRGSQWTTDGYTEIAMPTNGTVIPGYGGSGSVTVTANGIPFGAWQALYWIRTVGGAFNAGSFAMVLYTPTDFAVPSNWIYIAGQNADDGRLKLGTGEILDFWHAPTFANSWINYNAGFAPAGYRKDAAGYVRLRGLVASGTMSTAIFTLPVGSRPGYTLIFTAHAGGGLARIDVQASGPVIVAGYVNATGAVGNNGYVSLEGITFLAEN